MKWKTNIHKECWIYVSYWKDNKETDILTSCDIIGCVMYIKKCDNIGFPCDIIVSRSKVIMLIDETFSQGKKSFRFLNWNEIFGS